MNQANETQTLNDFQHNTTFYAERLKQSQQPLVLTVDGRAELVVIDAEAFQAIVAKAEFAENVQAVKEGVEEFERGEGRSARQALAELAEKHGISR